MKIQFYGPPNEKKAAERIAEKLGGSELARVAAMATVSMISHGYCEYTESEAFETVKDLICEYCGHFHSPRNAGQGTSRSIANSARKRGKRNTNELCEGHTKEEAS